MNPVNWAHTKVMIPSANELHLFEL